MVGNKVTARKMDEREAGGEWRAFEEKWRGLCYQTLRVSIYVAGSLRWALGPDVFCYVGEEEERRW